MLLRLVPTGFVLIKSVQTVFHDLDKFNEYYGAYPKAQTGFILPGYVVPIIWVQTCFTLPESMW